MILILISATAFILALTVHEFSHALVAYLLGDQTAKQAGRLTLNPLAHIDPLGLLLLFIIRFGWAKPVPFNPYYFKYPRFYSVLVGFAGPTSNLLLATLSLISLKASSLFLSGTPLHISTAFFSASAWINVMLCVFNFLPFPPLDGSHLIRAVLPAELRYAYDRVASYGIFVLLVLLMIPPVNMKLSQLITSVIQLLEQAVNAIF